MTTNDDDFLANAKAATARALSSSNPAEALARSLTDSDNPKITKAAKSFAGLVAARSLTTTQTDADSAAAAAAAAAAATTGDEGTVCVFRKSANPAKASLLCARSLLSVINSTEIPLEASGGGGEEDSKIDVDEQLEKDVVRIVWNGLLKEGATTKPSKALGRRSLVLAFPYVMDRIQQDREGESLVPPDVDPLEFQSYFMEFGRLLIPLDGSEDKDDDGALIWSTDEGAAELSKRRQRREKRGKEAAAAAEAEAKARVANAVGAAATTANATTAAASSSTVTIEEISEDEN